MDRGVEWLTVLALGSPVPVPVAMPGKKPAMEERRDECWDDEGWFAGDNNAEPCLNL